MCGVLHVPHISTWDTSGFPPKTAFICQTYSRVQQNSSLQISQPVRKLESKLDMVPVGSAKGLVPGPNSGSLNPHRSDQQPKTLTMQPPLLLLKWGSLEKASINSAIS